MMLNDDKKDKKKAFGGKALYITLAVCLLMSSAVGISSMKKTSGLKVGDEDELTEKPTYVTVQKKPVSNTTLPAEKVELTTVPVVETTVEAEAVFDNDSKPLEESTTQPPKEFRTPVSLSIGMDYSMGIPVFSSTMSDYRTHNGVDFLGNEGDNVSSVGEGDVISVKKDPVWGVCVSVDHGDGIISTVSGLADDDALITAGTHVYPGTVIGRLGSVPVEAADNSHIHLEVRCDGKLIDPLVLLGMDGSNINE